MNIRLDSFESETEQRHDKLQTRSNQIEEGPNIHVDRSLPKRRVKVREFDQESDESEEMQIKLWGICPLWYPKKVSKVCIIVTCIILCILLSFCIYVTVGSWSNIIALTKGYHQIQTQDRTCTLVNNQQVDQLVCLWNIIPCRDVYPVLPVTWCKVDAPHCPSTCNGWIVILQTSNQYTLPTLFQCHVQKNFSCLNSATPGQGPYAILDVQYNDLSTLLLASILLAALCGSLLSLTCGIYFAVSATLMTKCGRCSGINKVANVTLWSILFVTVIYGILVLAGFIRALVFGTWIRYY